MPFRLVRRCCYQAIALETPAQAILSVMAILRHSSHAPFEFVKTDTLFRLSEAFVSGASLCDLGLNSNQARLRRVWHARATWRSAIVEFVRIAVTRESYRFCDAAVLTNEKYNYVLSWASILLDRRAILLDRRLP